ncbi:MAG: V-type ATP synthase subunit D [Candidatus Omnitrophica bacterium CG_4_9_14_0_2_um_filter_42_8]|nr:MAG: V-type ATP synthase subunit D [Candidatus Omnitrophica bacterium CG22_combo_CG10-13_8_21_14_all_43_16]PJC47027.1 MAG: V-type ATP synthase subunit D [Candidatus Omnitrophica bacterium CG_4_9_14_0_2_um_filter_42_8]
MAKIKFTKGELKRQRDALKRFERYLPILQLKKQQMQLEIQHARQRLNQKIEELDNLENDISEWAGLLEEPGDYVAGWIKPKDIVTASFNIAGVDIPVFERVDFEEAEYDLFLTPLWVDKAIITLRKFITLLEEEKVLNRQLEILTRELRITNQRVNLFEKVKIPECVENIRRIRIYMGDQQASAVGRSKIAKKKIERMSLEVALA